ncbi:transcription factor E2F2 [Antennarius striatus]|uniref:transcription factor E2F2 n=1 Tax=Antennarius striatus TaxID=241820 RepID=UPI0035AF8D98
MVKCAVTGCPNRTVDPNRGSFSNRTPKRFFNFPKDPTRIKVWLAALRETDRKDCSEQHLICEDHFLPEDISPQGVTSDAIPIMPPCLDGPMGLINPWGADSCEEDEPFGMDEDEDDDDDEAPSGASQDPGGGVSTPPEVEPEAESSSTRSQQKNLSIPSGGGSRPEPSLLALTRGFLQLILEAPDGAVDLKEVARRLHTRRRRVGDVTAVLDGIRLVQMESAHRVKWIGSTPVSSFLRRKQLKLQRELRQLKLVESTLDGLIKTCAQQLFHMTDQLEDASAAYVTRGDVTRLQAFRDQTLIVVQAPEETKLEIPVPSEDRVQIHLKAGRGPILVWTCDVESGDAVTSDPGCFLTLEDSRIRTAALHTGPQSAGQTE